MGFFSENIFESELQTSERRVSNRISAEDAFKVDFQTTSLIRISGIGSGKDISATGMRFATFAPLKKGEVLETEIFFNEKFPGVKKVSLQMQVMRVYKPSGAKRYRVGIRFLESPRYKPEFEVVRQFIWWLQTQIL